MTQKIKHFRFRLSQLAKHFGNETLAIKWWNENRAGEACKAELETGEENPFWPWKE